MVRGGSLTFAEAVDWYSKEANKMNYQFFEPKEDLTKHRAGVWHLEDAEGEIAQVFENKFGVRVIRKVRRR